MVVTEPYHVMTGGTKTVATAGVAERLVAASTPCRGVWVAARKKSGTNTDVVYVGPSTPNMPLEADDLKGFFIEIANAYSVWVDAAVNGEGVEYTIFQ